MALVKYHTPFDMMTDIRQEMNRLFDTGCLSDNAQEKQSFASWRPQVDVKEEADKYIVHADLPGVAAKDIRISLNDNTLTIQGERHSEAKTNEKDYQRVERFSGSFCRQFTLPQYVEGSQIEATSRDGVLELTIPKKEVAATQYIEVKTE